MAKSKENWLVAGAWEKINPVWRDRMLVILEDLAKLKGLNYALILDSSGKRLSEVIGASGPVPPPDSMLPPARFATLYGSASSAFRELGEPAPTHIIEDYSDQTVFVGFVAEIILIASFDSQATRGAVILRMTKRIKHLHTLQKSRERGALYV